MKTKPRKQKRLEGKTVALYVGGNKAWSLVRAFEEVGMDVMMSGTKNGIKEDYERIKETVRDGTIIVDDANSTELARLLKKYKPNLLISGAKEKYISLKLGIPFCDFNHDRISAFAGFKGFVSFAKEVDASVSSPVFNLASRLYPKFQKLPKWEVMIMYHDKKFAVVNPSKMCQPMGAIQALLGVKNTMPLIHGAQGCSTYMRFQLIRHFREPIEVASTSMNEKTVIYGGEFNLMKALKNITEKQSPDMIVVTSSCLTETIGDDMAGIIENSKMPTWITSFHHHPSFNTQLC